MKLVYFAQCFDSQQLRSADCLILVIIVHTPHTYHKHNNRLQLIKIGTDTA